MNRQATDRPPQSAGPSADQLSWAVHDLAAAIAETDVAVSAVLGVTPGDYLAIKHLLMRPHELGPTELGRLLGMSSGSATALVDRLAEAGHVVRQPHGQDRRRRVLDVSQASHRKVLHELNKRAADVEELARSHTATEREAITKFIQGLAARHRRRSERPPP